MTDFLKQLLPFIPEHLLNPPDPGKYRFPYAPGFKPPEQDQIAKPKQFVTGVQLRKIVPNISVEYANTRARLYNEILPKYGLDVPDIFHEYIATTAHESGGFTSKSENLNYGAYGLASTWPSRYAIKGKPNELAFKLARNPQAIANNAYANRNGNGNEASGDGWRYRGGGDIQLTGRGIIGAYAKFINKPVEETSDLIRTSDYYAIDSSCWYFCVYKSLKDEAERDEFVKITRTVNGGLIGIEDRRKYYERAKSVLG